eukprot:SM003343S12869  [mRNA]  locus=s3343:269:1458:+ [translate_table: standard]
MEDGPLTVDRAQRRAPWAGPPSPGPPQAPLQLACRPFRRRCPGGPLLRRQTRPPALPSSSYICLRYPAVARLPPGPAAAAAATAHAQFGAVTDWKCRPLSELAAFGVDRGHGCTETGPPGVWGSLCWPASAAGPGAGPGGLWSASRTRTASVAEMDVLWRAPLLRLVLATVLAVYAAAAVEAAGHHPFGTGMHNGTAGAGSSGGMHPPGAGMHVAGTGVVGGMHGAGKGMHPPGTGMRGGHGSGVGHHAKT